MARPMTHRGGRYETEKLARDHRLISMAFVNSKVDISLRVQIEHFVES